MFPDGDALPTYAAKPPERDWMPLRTGSRDLLRRCPLQGEVHDVRVTMPDREGPRQRLGPWIEVDDDGRHCPSGAMGMENQVLPILRRERAGARLPLRRERRRPGELSQVGGGRELRRDGAHCSALPRRCWPAPRPGEVVRWRRLSQSG